MSDNRSGRVNALACAILDANGDTSLLTEQMRFFSDLTQEDIDRAMGLAHWVRKDGAALFVRHLLGPMAAAEPVAERVTA